MINKADAILSLNPESEFVLTEDELKWLSPNINKPSDEEIQKKLEELKLAEPMRRLREERNRRLAETDWWAMKEVDGWQMSPQQRVYRKNLRDLPETSPYPMLNENDELTNVDWPEKP